MDRIMLHGIRKNKVKKVPLVFEKGVYKLASETRAIENNTGNISFTEWCSEECQWFPKSFH